MAGHHGVARREGENAGWQTGTIIEMVEELAMFSKATRAYKIQFHKFGEVLGPYDLTKSAIDWEFLRDDEPSDEVARARREPSTCGASNPFL